MARHLCSELAISFDLPIGWYVIEDKSLFSHYIEIPVDVLNSTVCVLAGAVGREAILVTVIRGIGSEDAFRSVVKNSMKAMEQAGAKYISGGWVRLSQGNLVCRMLMKESFLRSTSIYYVHINGLILVFAGQARKQDDDRDRLINYVASSTQSHMTQYNSDWV